MVTAPFLIDPVTAASLPGVQLIDVRCPSDFESRHARGARNLPVDRLTPQSLAGELNVPVILMSEAGQRARLAREMLRYCDRQVLVVEGGLAAWKAAGLPLVRGSGGVVALDRQVRIAVGSLVLLGVALAALVHPGFIWLAGFCGAGLVFAGVTDSCGMALALARLPWNRVSAGEAGPLCPSAESSGSLTSNGDGA